MREVFDLLAMYSRKANESMIGILEKMPEADLKKDMGAYFKSILGTVEHLVLTNIMWLKRTNGLFNQKYKSIASNEIMNLPDEEIVKRMNAGHPRVFGMKKELDELFEKYVFELDEADLDKRLRYRNMKGEEIERTYWNTILHIFNHETHHRGAVSAMLDQLKINNDYSGILLYVK